jgi:hypothetical protein
VKSSPSNGVLAAASRAVSAARFHFSSSSLSTEVWCSFWRNILILVPVFLAYLAIAAFASGTLRLIGVAGAIVFGVMVLFGGPAGARQIRPRPVAPRRSARRSRSRSAAG